jgi:hypothetical protein
MSTRTHTARPANPDAALAAACKRIAQLEAHRRSQAAEVAPMRRELIRLRRRDRELTAALAREQRLRREAEGRSYHLMDILETRLPAIEQRQADQDRRDGGNAATRH